MQKTNSWHNFNGVPKGSNDDNFGQTKYGHDQRDEMNTMTYTTCHDGPYREKQQAMVLDTMMTLATTLHENV